MAIQLQFPSQQSLKKKDTFNVVKIKRYFILLLMISLFSCVTKQKIQVVYLTGDIEYNSQQSITEVWDNPSVKNRIPKTIKVSKIDFLRLNNYFDGLNILKNRSDCDARMYVKSDAYEYCINVDNLVCNNSDSTSKDDLETIYLLKCITGYYNYFSRDKLYNDLAIKRFGIPKNYKYHYNLPTIKKEEFMKVELIEE